MPWKGGRLSDPAQRSEPGFPEIRSWVWEGVEGLVNKPASRSRPPRSAPKQLMGRSRSSEESDPDRSELPKDPASPPVSSDDCDASPGLARPRRLSFRDRYLTLWIVLAIGIGILLGYAAPGFRTVVGLAMVPGTPVPLFIGLGLMLMMYPPLAKVRYEKLGSVFRDPKILGLSLLQNWLVGPLVMFAFAVIFLRGEPAFLIGLVLIGSARCIAMVLVWNDLAGGHREYAAGLVAFNSLFQVAFYPVYILFFTGVLFPLVGVSTGAITIAWPVVVESVLLYLGIPFLAGYAGRVLLRRWRGDLWYSERFLPAVAPLALWALLFTILVMFSYQGAAFIAAPLDVLLIAIPLVLYYAVMFVSSFEMGRRAGADYPRTAALSLTAASNNFELAIAVAVAVFGISSGVAFASVVGPLVEVPVLLGLVQLSRFWRGRWTQESHVGESAGV